MIKVPCSQCGKMIEIHESQKGHKNYCDKFCRSRAQLESNRNTRSTTTRKKKTKSRTSVRRRCGSCGG